MDYCCLCFKSSCFQPQALPLSSRAMFSVESILVISAVAVVAILLMIALVILWLWRRRAAPNASGNSTTLFEVTAASTSTRLAAATAVNKED